MKYPLIGLCIVFCLVSLVFKDSQSLPVCHISRMAPYNKGPALLSGTIDSDPVYKNRSVSFVLNAEGLESGKETRKTCGKVLVRVFDTSYRFFYGDRLFLEGKLHKPFSFSDEFNYAEYLRNKGIYLLMSVRKGSLIVEKGHARCNPVRYFALRMKHRIRDAIFRNISSPSAEIMAAIVLGDRYSLPSYIREALVKSGTVHIIAISGLHLGIVAFIILLILKLTKIPRKPRFILTISLLAVYCILTGANPPVVRATIMVAVLLISYVLEREVNIYNSLSLAALAMLAVNPREILQASFQLSFLSVISIVWLSPKIKSLFPKKLDNIPWLRYLVLAFSVSCAAWIGLLPLTAYYFRMLTPVTVLANMLIVPYAAFITASAFSFALIGTLVPPLASALAMSIEFLMFILFKINAFLIALPGAYFKLQRVPVGYVFFYYVLLVIIFNFSGLFGGNFRFRKAASFCLKFIRQPFRL